MSSTRRRALRRDHPREHRRRARAVRPAALGGATGHARACSPDLGSAERVERADRAPPPRRAAIGRSRPVDAGVADRGDRRERRWPGPAPAPSWPAWRSGTPCSSPPISGSGTSSGSDPHRGRGSAGSAERSRASALAIVGAVGWVVMPPRSARAVATTVATVVAADRCRRRGRCLALRRRGPAPVLSCRRAAGRITSWRSAVGGQERPAVDRPRPSRSVARPPASSTTTQRRGQVPGVQARPRSSPRRLPRRPARSPRSRRTRDRARRRAGRRRTPAPGRCAAMSRARAVEELGVGHGR